MARLVGDHVCARAGEGGLAARRELEEGEALTIVVGIEVLAMVGLQIELLGIGRAGPVLDRSVDPFPHAQGGQGCFAALPEQELRSARAEHPVGGRRWEREPGARGGSVASCRLLAHGNGALSERIVWDVVDRHSTYFAFCVSARPYVELNLI